MKKLLIWGTGKYAKIFLDNQYKGEIIGFVETNKSVDKFKGLPVYSVTEIPDEYDYILVTVLDASEIYILCKKLNLDLSKVIFLHGVRQRVGCTDESILKGILLDANYTLYCAEFGITKDSFIKKDIEAYQRLNHRPSFEIEDQYMWPVIRDKYLTAGTIDNYFWQDLWAARLIMQSGIKEHFDIGSRLDGFIAHLLAAGVDVTMIDIRKFPEEVEQLHTVVDDATSLHQISDESIQSMSALCSLEHFGLGRYGDPIDPEACFKCFNNIQRKLKKGGRLYISLPIGRERVEFNAHRVFFATTVIDCFKTLHLEQFSCTAQGKIEYNVDLHKYDNDQHNGDYRYGLFYFIK